MLPFSPSYTPIPVEIRWGMPLNNWYLTRRAQSLYYVEDLIAAGLVRGGTIYSIGFKVYSTVGVKSIVQNPGMVVMLGPHFLFFMRVFFNNIFVSGVVSQFCIAAAWTSASITIATSDFFLTSVRVKCCCLLLNVFGCTRLGFFVFP